MLRFSYGPGPPHIFSFSFPTAPVRSWGRMIGERNTLEELLAERLAENIATALDIAVERLAEGDRRRPWLTPEEAREYLGLTPKQWERYAPRLPRRYLSERVVRYPVSELDAALEAAVRPEASVVNSRHDEKTGAEGRGGGGSGGARSLNRALERGVNGRNGG